MSENKIVKEDSSEMKEKKEIGVETADMAVEKGDSMELTKQEEKEQKNREKEQKKKEKAEKKAEKKAAKEKDKTPMEPARKKKIIKRSIIGGIAAVFVLFIVVSNISAANAKPMVTTTPVETGDLEQTLNTSGSVTSGEIKTYFAPVSVEIGKINVTAGETVKKGEPIVTYDETALANEKKTTELSLQANEGSYKSSVQKNNESLGDLGEAHVNLEVLEQQITDIDNYIKELQKKVNDKKAALAYEGSLLQISLIDWSDKPDSDEYENLRKLAESNQYEQTNNAEIRAWQEEINKYSDMLANCKEYRAEMKSQKTSAEGTKLNEGGKEELEAKSEIEKISAQEKMEAINASLNGIVAEFDGVVTEMNAIEGKKPAEGEQLFKLESTENVKVSISVTKYDLEKLALGQKAVVTIAGNKYEGEVSKIDKMATKNASGAPVVNTDIKIINPDENIFIGVEAKIAVNTATASQVLMIPVGAVNTDKDGDFVYAVENGLVVRKAVTTGISSDTYIEIKDGLTAQAQVLTEITAGITEGMAVTAIPAQ